MIRFIPVILCLFMLTGCAQTMLQHTNMVNAMNRKFSPMDYNRVCVFDTFGTPDKTITSVVDGVPQEVWIYKTAQGEKELLFNMHPGKTRYMKITIIQRIVTDVSFE